MKKFYSFALSVAVAFGAFAQAPAQFKVEKNNRQLELSDVKIEKIASNVERAVIADNKKNMMKAPQDATVDFASVAGTYMLQAYVLDRATGEAGDAMISIFEITEPDAEGNVKIQNFLADWYGIETNDLDATLYNDVVDASATSEGYNVTFLKIGLAQDLFTDPEDNQACQLYLYGPLTGDGNNYVFTGSEIEFMVYDGMLQSAYLNMGMWIGFKSADGKLYGYTPLVGIGGSYQTGVMAYKPNCEMTAASPIDQEGNTAEFTYPIYAEYVPTYSAIVCVGFGGTGEDIIWYVEPEDGIAEAIDAYAGSVSYQGEVYPFYLYTSQTEEHLIADAEIKTNPTSGNAVLTAESLYFLCELGWVDRFDNVRLEFPFAIEGLPEGEAGIENVTVDNNENAPVEYFNLQGVKVANPAAGLYIRRQGNTATKVLVK